MIQFSWTVECMEPDCGWAYGNTVKSDVEFQVKCHRSAHYYREAQERNRLAEERAALDNGMPEWTT